MDGIIRYRDLTKIKEMGFDALSISDHGQISGTYEFYKEAKKAGIKPILSMEAYYSPSGRASKETDDLGKARPNYHMILIAQNIKGYKNLIKLSSRAYTEGFYYSPRIDDELLEEYNEGLYATSACLGSRASQFILKGMRNEAKKLIEHHASIFKDRYFLELQCHYNEEQIMVNSVLMEFARELKLPLILTADSHYLAFGDKKLHDKFLCISTNSKIDDPNRFNFGDLDCSLSTPEEMEAKRVKFNLPEECISNTNWIADSITPNYFSDIYNRYPKFPDVPEGMTSDEYLSYLVKTKYVERYGKKPDKEVRERVEEELKILKRMGFSDYMLIRWDTIQYAENNGILVGPGRGSVGGSLVAYILGITKLDPIKYGMIFERFLNSGRGQIPMIFED